MFYNKSYANGFHSHNMFASAKYGMQRIKPIERRKKQERKIYKERDRNGCVHFKSNSLLKPDPEHMAGDWKNAKIK